MRFAALTPPIRGEVKQDVDIERVQTKGLLPLKDNVRDSSPTRLHEGWRPLPLIHLKLVRFSLDHLVHHARPTRIRLLRSLRVNDISGSDTQKQMQRGDPSVWGELAYCYMPLVIIYTECD
jgi:hypothetical protein